MDDKKTKTPPHWLGKPIVDDEHVHDLEMRAALNEFHEKMPRGAAESKAHDDYVQEQRERAAAHHLEGMKAAMATGAHEDAEKHWAFYDQHLKALGKEAVGAVPPEIEKRMAEEGKKPVYKFKAHKADLFAMHKPADPVPQNSAEAPMAKAEAKQCQWKLGERRCKRLVSEKYCHDHIGHWANKIKTKEDAQVIAKALLKGVAKVMAGVLAKADLPPGTGQLAPPPAAPAGPLHGDVNSFMTGLKAIPKGHPNRGKYITQHMNHGPFLLALKSHPQGPQVHQMLTQHMNAQANAGFKPGQTVATAKTELAKGDVIKFPGNPAPAQDQGKAASVTPMPAGHPLDGIHGVDYTHLLKQHGVGDEGHTLNVTRDQDQGTHVYTARLWNPRAEDHKDYRAEGTLRTWPTGEHNYEGFGDPWNGTGPDGIEHFEAPILEALKHAAKVK